MPTVQVTSINNNGFHLAPFGRTMPTTTLSVSSLQGRASPTRRRLFAEDGPSAADDAHRLAMERELAEIQREQSRKWNFDFSKGEPLNGRYAWERPSHPPPPPVAIKRTIDNQQIGSSKQARIVACNNNNNLSQSKITDFMKQQKNSEVPVLKRRPEEPQEQSSPSAPVLSTEASR